MYYSDIISSFGFNSFSCITLGLIFGAAVFFDLSWPERRKARSTQWAWKLGATASTVFSWCRAWQSLSSWGVAVYTSTGFHSIKRTLFGRTGINRRRCVRTRRGWWLWWFFAELDRCLRLGVTSLWLFRIWHFLVRLILPS